MKFSKVYIEITNRCNLNCHFCLQSKQVKKDMSIEEFKRIIQEVKQVSHNIYLHVKGEPLLHPHLDAILHICDEAKMRVNMTTNGTLLKDTFPLLMRHECIKKINVSLHCEHHDPQYYHHVLTSCDHLSKRIYIMYRLWTLLDHHLDDASLKIIEQLKHHYHLNEKIMNDLKTKPNVKIKDTIYVDKDNEFVWPSLDNEIQNEVGYCHALKTHFAILVNGDVVPCCLDGEGIIHLGNIHQETIHEIMQKERFKRLKKSFQDRKPCEALCQKCGFLTRKK
ncbi:MAG: radical SAM protein [Erysipelotrichia bacterium]|nr:radical SAM protein [Erysipelotrichia bacterium]